MLTNKSGAILVIVILAVIGFTLLVTSYFYYQSVSTVSTQKYKQNSELYYQANSGQEIGEYKIIADSTLLDAILKNPNVVYNPFAAIGDTVGALGLGTKVINGYTITVSIKRKQ